MILSVVKFDSKNAKNLFWFGCAFMGYIFIFNPVSGSGADGVRVAQGLVDMSIQKTGVNDLIKNLYVEDGTVDIYQTLTTYLVSRFTSNPHYLFLILAIVFGFFYSRNVWRVLNYITSNKNETYIWLFIVMLILLNPIWNINGGRMWVALHVFIYGLFGYFFDGKPTKLVWAVVSVFIHFSFLFPLLLLMILAFLPKRNTEIYFLFFIISTVINDINIITLKNTIEGYLPGFLTYKVDAYMNEDLVSSISDGYKDWSTYLYVSKYMNIAFKYILLLVFWLNRNIIIENSVSKNILYTYLFFGGCINILSGIPSMGRFVTLEDFIMFSLLLFCIGKVSISAQTKDVLKYSSLLLILPILLALRIGSIYYGHSLFWENFVGAIFLKIAYQSFSM